MTKDEQEALSYKYSDDAIILLPLSSGSIAIFNRAYELCGIAAPPLNPIEVASFWENIRTIWQRPVQTTPHERLTLEDLGL